MTLAEAIAVLATFRQQLDLLGAPRTPQERKLMDALGVVVSMDPTR